MHLSRGAADVLGIVREGVGQMPPMSARELPDEELRRLVECLWRLR